MSLQPSPPPAPLPRPRRRSPRPRPGAEEGSALLAGLAGRRRLLVAASGGPDSQALLHWSVHWAACHGLVHLGAVAVDHGLRPGAAEELTFARRSCAALGVPFVQKSIGPLPPGNRMQQARLARRRALRRAAEQAGAEAVLLGHTADDQAETVLQHLARGAGLAGAAGMAPARGRAVRFVRPFLGLTRDDVERYLAAHGLASATDPTNFDLRHSRASVRHRVLPALAAPYPRCAVQLAGFAARAAADEALLRRLAGAAQRRCTLADGALSTAAWRRLPDALRVRVLQRFLTAWGAAPDARALARLAAELAEPAGERPLRCGSFVGAHVERTAAPASVGGEVLRARAADTLRPRRGAAPRARPFRPPLAHPEEALLLADGDVDFGPWRVGVRQLPVAAARAACAHAGRAADVVAFAAEAPLPAFGLRAWREGDRLRPFGLCGSTTVGELFTNAKVPRARRTGWPVLTLDGAPAWVVGLRRGSQQPLGAQTQLAWLFWARLRDATPRPPPAACADACAGKAWGYTVDVI